MKTIEALFEVQNARSGAFADYEPGEVAFVTNGFSDNGVLGYVRPQSRDRVFHAPSIIVSAFCEATVHLPPFIARGNGGSGLIVLVPRNPMTFGQLAYYAAYINEALRWRFSWSRQANATRIKHLTIPEAAPRDATFPVLAAMPQRAEEPRRGHWTPRLRPIGLDELFDLRSGDYHELNRLADGAMPVVSCGDANNGISGYFDVPAAYSHRLTIAFNGMNTLTTKYHPYEFAAKDDVAVCIPRSELRLTTLLFIQVMMNRERWRYSYYRKCYMEKLKRFEVMLPVKGAALDEDTMARVISGTPYWPFLSQQFGAA